MFVVMKKKVMNNFSPYFEKKVFFYSNYFTEIEKKKYI